MKHSFLFCFLLLMMTSCDYVGDGISSLGSLCIIAFGLIVGYIVYEALNKNQEENHESLLAIIVGLITITAFFVLAVIIPEDISTTIGIIALIIGVIILILYLISKNRHE